MSNILNKCYLLLVLCIFAFVAFAQEAEIMPQNNVLKPTLLRLADADFINIGKIMDREWRDFSFTLSNTQKRPLKVLKLRANCPCLDITEPVINKVLQPDEGFTGKARINATKLPLGEFHRLLIVEVENEELQLISLRGESVPMLEYEPAQTIELGSFAGVNVPWKRRFKIKSRFPEGRLQLHEPKASAHFDYKLSSLSAQEFELEISAKMPLPVGRLRQIIDIPCSGVENYGPVQVALFGRVTGWKLALANKVMQLNPQEADDKGRICGEVKLSLADEKARGLRMQRMLGRGSTQKKSTKNLPNMQPVSNEEEETDPLDSLETWKSISEELSIDLPEGCELQKTPQPDGVILKLSFTKELLAKRSVMTLMLKRNNKAMQRIVVQSVQ